MIVPPAKPARVWLSLSFIAAISFISGSILADWLNLRLASQNTRMTVEAFIPRGGRIAFYYNNRRESEILPVVPNQWHSYVFKVPATVNLMRLDPTEAAGTASQIRSIRFTKGAGASVDLNLSTLPGWSKYNTTIAYNAATGIATFDATGPDQFAMSAVDINLGKTDFLIADLDNVSLLWGIVAAVAIYFLLQTWEAGWQTVLTCFLLMPIALFVPRLALWTVSLLHLRPASPSDVVGNPTYTGVAKSAELLSVGLGIVFAVGVVWLGILAERHLRRSSISLNAAPVAIHRRDLVFLSVVTALFALLSFPDLQGICRSLLSVHHPYAFDPQIQVLWQEMAHRGLLPDRDYWYPYTGLYNKFAPLYPEVLINYFHNISVFAAMAASTYVLFAKRRFVSALVLLPLLPLLEASGLAWPDASWRYLLCASVVTMVAAALATRKIVWFVLAGLWSTYVLSQESAQLVYAVPAVLFLFAASLALENNFATRRQLLRLFGWGAGAFTVTTVVWLVIMAVDHRLAEWWIYMSGLDIQSLYFGFPFDARFWFHQPFSVETFGYVLLIALFILSSLQVFRCRGYVPASHLAPFAIGLATAMMFQKQILRPGIMTQFISVPLYGLLMILAQYERDPENRRLATKPRTLRVAWGAFACAFLSVLFGVFPGKAGDVFHRYAERIKTTPDNLSYATGHKEQWAAATAYYFSPQAITMEDTPATVAKEEFLKATANAPGTVFALGDSAYWYLLLNQPPPFYIMFFHQAPLEAQENTIHWLETKQPRYVIWEPSQTVFDAVPNFLRVPLLYAYVAANYVPSTTVRSFLVLRRRNPGEPADLAFWSKTPASVVEMGFIPALSRLRSFAISSKSAFPVLYALVHVDHPVTGHPHQVSLMVGSAPLTVSFAERESVFDYPIRLDRLPLVAAAQADGVEPKSTGPDVSLQHGFLRRDLLY